MKYWFAFGAFFAVIGFALGPRSGQPFGETDTWPAIRWATSGLSLPLLTPFAFTPGLV